MREKKERPYIRRVKRLSKPEHKPKIRVTVVLEKGIRSRTFSFVSWGDVDTVADMFLMSTKRKVKV